MTFLILLIGSLLAAVIPMVICALIIWWFDRYEKEPRSLLVVAFLWGAGPALVLAVIAELLIGAPVDFLGPVGKLLGTIAVAPIVEEVTKAIMLFALMLSLRAEFDDVLDGIIYGAMIGFGFALTENVFAYFVPIASQQGLGAGATNLFWRSIAFGANHAFWTAMMGAAFGYARLAQEGRQRRLAPIGGWVQAVTFHAIHNVGATLTAQTGCLSLGMSLIVDWGGILLLLLVAAQVLRKERQWIERGLVEEVRRGMLSQQEFVLLQSATQRFARRWGAWRRGGRPAFRAVGCYYQCATDLAFAKQHLRSLGDEGGNLAQVQRLRQELGAQRQQAAPWL